MCDSGVVEDKPTVEIGKTQEGLYFLHLGRDRPDSNAIKFYRVHGELTGFHNHSKVFNFTTSMLSMSCEIRGGNKKVVHVNDKQSLSNHVLE